VLLDQRPQDAAVFEQLRLAHEFVERAWAYARGKRRFLRRVLGRRSARALREQRRSLRGLPPRRHDGSRRSPRILSWVSSTGVGAPDSGSTPDCVFGNATTSRMFSVRSICIITRWMQQPIPPCGGGPYRNASRKNPKRCSASSGEIPSASKTFRW